MTRAIWLIKMTSAYSMAISEAKMKKRQVPDSSQGLFHVISCMLLKLFDCSFILEWTSTVVRFIKEQLIKLQEFYIKTSITGSSSNVYASNAAAYHNGSPLMSDDQKLALRQFNYCQQLCKAMFEVANN